MKSIHKLTVVFMVATSLLAWCPVSKAITAMRATQLAVNYQHSQCGSFLWGCGRPDYVWATCRGPYPGNSQWKCFGKVSEWWKAVFITTSQRRCSVSSSWSPYGKRVAGNKYNCTKNLPARDRK